MNFNLPSFQKFGDICPLVSVDFVCVEDDQFLLVVDRCLFDVRIEVVVPSLTALFACAALDSVFILQHLGDEGPSFGSELSNQAHDRIVFLK